MSTVEQANDTKHYILIVIAIIIGLVGVYLRFAGDTFALSSVSNLIMIVAIVIALKGVFDIMK